MTCTVETICYAGRPENRDSVIDVQQKNAEIAEMSRAADELYKLFRLSLKSSSLSPNLTWSNAAGVNKRLALIFCNKQN